MAVGGSRFGLLARIAALLLLSQALLLAGVLGAAESTPKYGGTLTYALDGTIPTLDVHKSNQITTLDSIGATCFESLVAYTYESGYVPMLAESWELPDSQTVVLHLRHGVKFHDGTMLDGKDVKASIQRFVDPKIAAPNAGFMNMVGTITLLDDYTVQLHLNIPYAGILWGLYYLKIVSSEEVAANYDAAPLIGTGPFRYLEWIPADHLTVVKNPDYWRAGFPYLDKIVFKTIVDAETRYANLEADAVQALLSIAPEQVARFKSNPHITVLVGTDEVTFRAISMATDIPPLDNILVRKALNYAFDKVTWVRTVLAGYGTPQLNCYSPQSPYWNPDTAYLYPYDLVKAKELFNEAGYPDKYPASASPLVITIAAGWTELEKAAIMLQSALETIGIPCVLEKYDIPTWRNIRETKHMLTASWNYGSAEPSAILDTNYMSQVHNLPHYYSPALASLIQTGKATPDPAVRKAIYFEIQRLLAEDVVPVIWCGSAPVMYATQSYVHDLTVAGSVVWHDFSATWLDK